MIFVFLNLMLNFTYNHTFEKFVLLLFPIPCVYFSILC
jgi:hypothetical protein